MTIHDSDDADAISGEIKGTSGVSSIFCGISLLCDDLASTKLCVPASCSHVESYYIFDVSSVIVNLTSYT